MNTKTFPLSQEEYSQWYIQIAKQGELFEYSPVAGCITFLPKAVSIWEKIKALIDKKLIERWVKNIYLPLLIPLSFLEKEKEHIEWFSPELAIVTIGWGKELEEKLVIRPTSETLFCDFFKNKLKSYKDLPLLYNQWANVMRWEMRTRPFLRTSEFYWQEWHTLHETKEEATTFALDILHNVYEKTITEELAIATIPWRKTQKEKFAWADTTYCIESMMKNGRALQMCTSHLLSQNFMKQFDIRYHNKDWEYCYPFYTSWGISTRILWAMISCHSDEKGLIIPPRIAPYHAWILTIYGKNNKEAIHSYVQSILSHLQSTVSQNTHFFDTLLYSHGKYNLTLDLRNVHLWEKIIDFERSWYPVWIECGEREMKQQTLIMVNRITKRKEEIPLGKIEETLNAFLREWQDFLFKQSEKQLKESIYICNTFKDIEETILQGKFALYKREYDDDAFENLLKESCKATTRCIPFASFLETMFPPLEGSQYSIIARAF